MNEEQEKQLAAPLDAKRVKTRQGRGSGPALSYLETHDVIRTANAIFGHGQWGHEVVELRALPPVEFAKDTKKGVCVGYVCTVRLTVAGCVPTSGIGFGDATEYQATALITAHELAAKEAESDALKRALKNYGDQFGLALYDKAAATSGHVVREPAPAAGGAGNDGTPPRTPPAAPVSQFKQPETPRPTDAQLTELEKLLKTWKKIKPDFDLEGTMDRARGNDAPWVVRQIATAKANIEKAAEGVAA